MREQPLHERRAAGERGREVQSGIAERRKDAAHASDQARNRRERLPLGLQDPQAVGCQDGAERVLVDGGGAECWAEESVELQEGGQPATQLAQQRVVPELRRRLSRAHNMPRRGGKERF
jgi:hypothetical protein